MFPINTSPTNSRRITKQDTGLHVRLFPDVPFPKLEKPAPIGYFSVNTERDYEPNATQLRYYSEPSSKNFPLDLNRGLSLAIKKPESSYDERLDHLLKFICDQQQKVPPPNLEVPVPPSRPLPGAEFVCWRGLLRLIMCTPYENRQDWVIHVTRFNDTFYMCKLDTEQEKFLRSRESDEQKRMCAYGFKFEQHCLAESPFIDPDTSAPVDECSEFSCVFRTKLSGMDILFGAEMDGIISEQPVQLDDDPSILDKLHFIELKVRQGNLNARQRQSYHRFKTRNWWCQAFLVGIQDIYVGLRNEKGYVQKVERVEVRSLPKQSANCWTPTACACFLTQFLQCLKSLMADVNCPYTTYEFYFNAQTSRITYECLKGKTPHSFLPDWYLALLQTPQLQ